MKIVIDARFTRTDHHDGISRYGSSLIAATSKIADVTMLISDKRQLALLPDVPYVHISSPLSPANCSWRVKSTSSVPTSWSAPCRPWEPGAASTGWS
ncbi:glycosyl transferase, group 1 [Arthrobacter sp. Hiyo8]|nr:glycosyl transferase, group 1 [Arthrobacter sp. Hiyo8]